jgi:hypothetical protein
MLGLSGIVAAMAGPKRVVKSALIGIERFVSPIDIAKPEEPSDVYVAKNGTPQQNVAKVLEMMGGLRGS